MRGTTIMVAGGLLGMGCQPGFKLEDGVIAVGASYEVVVDDPDVSEISDVVDQEQGVFTIRTLRNQSFVLDAVAAGATEISVVALSPDREVLEQEAFFEAVPVDDVRFTPFGCSAPVHDGRVLLPPDTELTAEWSLSGEGRDLLGDTTFEAVGLEEVDSDLAARTVTWRTPGTPGGVFEVTTPVMGRPVATIEVFDALDVASVDVGQLFGPGPLRVGSSTVVETVVVVDGAAPCIDGLERQLTVATPETCSLDRDLQVAEAVSTEDRFDLFGLATGTCVVDVALVGTDISGAIQLSIID